MLFKNKYLKLLNHPNSIKAAKIKIIMISPLKEIQAKFLEKELIKKNTLTIKENNMLIQIKEDQHLFKI